MSDYLIILVTLSELFIGDYLIKYYLPAGEIPPGLPSVKLPPFSAENDSVGFLEMIRKLGSGVIVVPLVGVLENIAICKAFG